MHVTMQSGEGIGSPPQDFPGVEPRTGRRAHGDKTCTETSGISRQISYDEGGSLRPFKRFLRVGSAETTFTRGLGFHRKAASPRKIAPAKLRSHASHVMLPRLARACAKAAWTHSRRFWMA